MKTKSIVLTVLISAGLLAGTSAFAAGARGGNGQGNRGSGSGAGVPVQDGSGKSANSRGNPNSTGTPLRDGSGKANSQAKGAKDGSGNQANCPIPPKS